MAPKPVPYDLYTHCGIDYARVGNRYYEATPPLSDGSGNPPPGWGNPYQPGILTVISPTQAVFTDKPPPRGIRPGPIRRPRPHDGFRLFLTPLPSLAVDGPSTAKEGGRWPIDHLRPCPRP